MTYRIVSFSLLATLFVATAGDALAMHHVKKVTGTVVVIDTTRIEVEPDSGVRFAAQLDDNTTYLRGEARASQADVKVGDTVLLTVIRKEGKVMAKEVRVQVPQAPATDR